MINPKREKLEPEDLLLGYINGIFPMAEPNGTIYWYSPDPRCIIPINTYKITHSLKPILNKKIFEVRFNTCFKEVITACAKPRTTETDTWISEEIIQAYTSLNKLGYAISVEVFKDNILVGGLYGIIIGKAFFGESMFYTVPNASKVAFHSLMELLQENNFVLLDSQFINDNVKRYGAIEIPKNEYIKLLKKATSKIKIFEEELDYEIEIEKINKE